jgi:hypothetical protein
MLLCSYADIIIPWQRGDNLVAIDLITQHICSKLRCHDLLRIYPNLELLPSNFQVRGCAASVNPFSSRGLQICGSRILCSLTCCAFTPT